MSIVFPFPRCPLYDYRDTRGGLRPPRSPKTVRVPWGFRSPAPWGRGRGNPAEAGSLGVVLDDELFLDLGVDLRPDGQRVHQDPHLVRHDLEPGGHGALADLGPGDDER